MKNAQLVEITVITSFQKMLIYNTKKFKNIAQILSTIHFKRLVYVAHTMISAAGGIVAKSVFRSFVFIWEGKKEVGKTIDCPWFYSCVPIVWWQSS